MPSARPRPAARARAYQRGAHLYRRGETWYARGGSLPRGGVSLRTSDRAEAERELGRLLSEPRPVGRDPAPREAVEQTLLECVAAWVAAPHGYTRRTRESHAERTASMGRWFSEHGVTLPSQITPEKLDEWITERSKSVGRRTINRDLLTLRVCLRWCAERGHCAPVTALGRPKLREPERDIHKVIPSPAEVARTLDAITNKGHRDTLSLLYATGMRCDELRRLTVGDVRDGRVWIQPEAGPAATAEPTKGYRARAVPVAPEVIALATAFLAWRTGKRGRRAHKNTLTTALHQGAERARVVRFGLHDLRRGFATEAVRAGVPLTVVRDWLGHRLTQTTERYIGRYRDDRDTIAPLPAHLAARGEGATATPLRPPAAAESRAESGGRNQHTEAQSQQSRPPGKRRGR